MATLDQRLCDALSALADMWNQYCPPPMGHAYMSAGEDAEEVLAAAGLMGADGVASFPPEPPAPRPLSSLTDEEAKTAFELAFYYWDGLDALTVKVSTLYVEVESPFLKLVITQAGVMVASKQSQNACMHARFNAVAVVHYLDSLGIALGE